MPFRVLCPHPCDVSHAMPDNFVELLLDDIRDLVNNPTGVWADFNCVYNIWAEGKGLVQSGAVCEEDYPDPPDPSDYPDNTSSATLIGLCIPPQDHCGADY